MQLQQQIKHDKFNNGERTNGDLVVLAKGMSFTWDVVIVVVIDNTTNSINNDLSNEQYRISILTSEI